VREEVDGEPLDVRLRRAAVGVVLALRLRVHLSVSSSLSSPRGEAEKGAARTASCRRQPSGRHRGTTVT
jgi:hypothetical protein